MSPDLAFGLCLGVAAAILIPRALRWVLGALLNLVARWVEFSLGWTPPDHRKEPT